MILTQIIEEKEKVIEKRRSEVSMDEIKKAAAASSFTKRDFKKAISHDGINLIAEIKQRSPSKGILRRAFNPMDIGRAYAVSGARALSILTDEKFFGGNLSFIKEIRKEVNLPILEKDFIIDVYQIYEARFYGANAILLITDILTVEQLKQFREIALELGMDCLCEVHTEEDIEKAVKIGAEIIGINNRSLHDFKVDMETTPRLIRHIPAGKIIVSESGIKTHKDVMYLKSLGVNAVLIGEAFMTSDDIAAKVREVMGH